MSATHEVELCIPADPAFVRIARLTASGVAALIPFDVERIDDLRITVDEICSTLVEVGRGTIRLAFVVDGSGHHRSRQDAARRGGRDRRRPVRLHRADHRRARRLLRVHSHRHATRTFRATLEAGTQESAGAR